MEKFVTECAICGKEIEWEEGLFTKGDYGEPVCEECDENGD